jgi:hypothetical protein
MIGLNGHVDDVNVMVSNNLYYFGRKSFTRKIKKLLMKVFSNSIM